MAGLASDVGLTLENNMNRNLRKSQGLSDDMKTAVREFYYRPDISYTMPGMNDFMTVWTDYGKTKLRKHYLTLFLREAYHIYSGLYHNLKVIRKSLTPEFCKWTLLWPMKVSTRTKCKVPYGHVDSSMYS